MALSSINTGLQQTPDLTDIQSPGKLGFQFIQIYNAINVLAQAIDAYTGNTPADAQGNYQNQTIDQTVTVGNFTSLWVTAGASISSGFLVSFDSAGHAILADPSTVISAASNDAAGGQGYNSAGIPEGTVKGIAITSASVGAQIKVMLLGIVNFGAGALKPGNKYYLGSVPGSITYNPASMTAGWIRQPIGFAIDSAHMFINPAQFRGSF